MCNFIGDHVHMRHDTWINTEHHIMKLVNGKVFTVCKNHNSFPPPMLCIYSTRYRGNVVVKHTMY